MTGAPAYARRMRRAALSLLIVTACGGSPPRPAGPEPQSGPDLSRALAPVRWMVGDWEHPGGREHWVATAGVFYGVGFLADGGFEAMIIDDAPADAEGKPDGVLRLFAMPGGAAETVFTAAAADPDALRFANPQHDDPQGLLEEGIQGRADGPLLLRFVQCRAHLRPNLALPQSH